MDKRKEKVGSFSASLTRDEIEASQVTPPLPAMSGRSLAEAPRPSRVPEETQGEVRGAGQAGPALLGASRLGHQPLTECGGMAAGERSCLGM